jgi:hypothetical protein
LGFTFMRIALVGSARALIGAITAAALLALYAGCGEQSSERRGGGDIPDLTAGAPDIPTAGAAGDANDAAGAGGASGATGSELVPWCAAYKIINCVCQQCHQNPPLNGAPLPLVTYADTQGPYLNPATKKTVWQEMQTVIGSRFMPYTGPTDPPVMPPVKPLTDEQQTTMLTWLAQGALDTGGTDCPQTCDWTHGSPTGDP